MPPPPQTLCGTVVSAGKMMKTVTVHTRKQIYDSFLRKVPNPPPSFFLDSTYITDITMNKQHYTIRQSHLVSDPNSSLRTGDVVRIAAGWRASKHIRHIVKEIVTPWGSPLEERPPLPNLEELYAQERDKREAKMEPRNGKRREGKEGLMGQGTKANLQERHTDIVGGPEVVGGEERLVLEKGLADR
ncbi:MAG: hypothetical protein Q9220_004423 [cf. Caloplaca sp. 1 TL-2023]